MTDERVIYFPPDDFSEIVKNSHSLQKIVDDYCESSSSESYNELSGENILITPFNMKEELEEGHFDENGNYHWKCKRNDVDNWLENIDWNLQKRYKLDSGKEFESDEADDSVSNESFNEIYKKILNYLKPKETITGALCRLGKNTLTAAERWRLKKIGKDVNTNQENIEKVRDLTGLTNFILNKTGNVDIYQETYEQLLERVEHIKELNKIARSPQSLCEKRKTPPLDLFSDDFTEKDQAVIKKRQAPI